MKKNIASRFCSVLSHTVTALALVSSFSALGIEATFGVTVGAQHSDNITRSDDFPRSDIESQLRLDVGATGNTAQFDVELDYEFTASDFKNDFQVDNEAVDGEARILWTPLPDRFSWELANIVSDTVSDNRLADTPNNRQQRNIISTGPNVIFRMSPVDRLSAEYRYVDVKIENSNDNQDALGAPAQQGSDSERQIGRLSWTHNLSSASEFLTSVEYESAEASFDVAYTRLLVGYSVRLRNGSYEIHIGSNRVEPEIGDDFDTAAFNFAFTHNFGGHSIDLTLVKEATDTSVGFGTSALRSETFNPSDSNFDSFDIIERQRADIVYQNSLICGACSVSLSAFFDDQDYQSEPDNTIALAQVGDQRRYGFAVGFAYALRSNIDLSVGGYYDVNEFIEDPDGLKFEATDFSLGITFDVVRGFLIGLRVRRSARDANVEGLDFDELRGGINFSYRF